MQLKKIDDLKYFSGNEKKLLKERVRASGLAADQPNTMALTGRGYRVGGRGVFRCVGSTTDAVVDSGRSPHDPS